MTRFKSFTIIETFLYSVLYEKIVNVITDVFKEIPRAIE